MSKRLKIWGLALVTSLGLLLLGHFCVQHNSVSHLSQVIVRNHVAFTLWRYGLYTFMLICWPYFIRYIGKKQNWPIEVMVYLTDQRLKLLCFFIIIECFFAYNMLGKLFASF